MSFDRIRWAESVIADVYGDNVSTDRRSKGLIKFGENVDIDTDGPELLWGGDGLEIYPTTNSIDTISSSSASDTEIVLIEGHTIDADGEFTLVKQQATLNGQNKVVLDTPLARADTLENINGVDFTGSIYCYEDTAIVAGVPTDGTKLHLKATAGDEISLKCASTISKSDYFIVTGISMSIKRGGTATVDYQFQVREKGGVFITRFPFTVTSGGGGIHVPFDPPYIVPSNADFRMLCETTAINTQADAIVFGYLAKVI